MAVSDLLYTGHDHGHGYFGHYSHLYDHEAGHASLYLDVGLGHHDHYDPYYNHHSYYGSYYSPVYYPAYYREPIYYQDYGYDHYPDTYNSYTTVYAGGAAGGTYGSGYDSHIGNTPRVIVEPGYTDLATPPESIVNDGQGEVPRSNGGQPGGESAIEHASQASIPPSAALIELGNKAFAVGSYDQARDLYLRAVLTDDRDGYAKLFLGLASFARGDYSMAALGFRQAIHSTDDLMAQPVDLRQFYAEPTDLQGQLDRLEQLVIREPANRDARFLLGYIYYSIGQSEKALTVLTTLADLYPSDDLTASLRNSVDRIVTNAKATTTPAEGNQRP